MTVPIQLTASVQNETFGGVTYHIEGELVPALQLELTNPGRFSSIIFCCGKIRPCRLRCIR